MAIFPMSGVLRGFPPSTYRRTPRAKTLACPAIALFRATADAAPAKMSGISHLIYKWKVLSFSSKKYLIYELDTQRVHCVFVDGH
jgi:hypothetical protein